jgi:general secretion pathway protein D
MDIIPKQVLIEVLIAEVTLGDGTQYGVEWALRSDRSWGGYDGQEQIGLYNNRIGGLGDGVPEFDDDDNEIPVTDFLDSATGGLAYVFDSDRLRIFLHAQADTNKLNILSSPSIMAADNQEARIEVGEEVPIVTSEYIPQDRDQGDSTSRSIEYRNTGVILTVTPRINDKGLVAMEIAQEVSKAQAVAAGGIQSPVISNRKAETTLVVQSGQTVVIGGLIEEVESYVISGIPYFSRLPWIGFLFGTTSISKAKKELILLITPHVIETIDEADSVTREIREKMNDINELIKTEGGTWSTWDSN